MTIINADTLDAAASAAPSLGGLGYRFKKRYDAYSKALLEAPYTTPGGPVMPVDAQPFIDKRAALQGTEKTAAGGKQMAFGFAKKGIGDLLKGLGAKILANPGKAALVGGSLIALNELGGPTIQTLGKRIQKAVVPTMREREKLDEEAATAFAKSVGKELGTKTIGLMADVLSKAVQAPAELMGNRARAGVFQTLQTEDDVISQADPQQLAEAYHTMVRFAPTLATDKNAVKTFLRESVLYGTGPNFMSIKQLADAERAINPPLGGK